jgi:hypothetical protein
MKTPLTRLIPATLVLVVLITSGAAAMAAETTPPQPAIKRSTEAQNVGVFTGTFANGMPLYRLRSISVIGYRKVELAKLKREEQMARNKQVHAKGVAKGPA